MDKPTLWLIKLQLWVENSIKNSIVASICIFAIPLIIIGIIFSFSSEYFSFSRGVIFGVIWLALSPYLIMSAYRSTLKFFIEIKEIFSEKEICQRIEKESIKDLQSSKYLLFSIPLMIGADIVLITTIFKSAPILIKFWIAVTFGILFFLSGVGFWGILVMINIIRKICKCNLRVNPFHPDQFGGLSKLGSFAVKGSIYFFSGALLFPLTFEVIRYLGSAGRGLDFVLCTIFGGFLLVGILGFVVPQLIIKAEAGEIKEQLLIESEEKLQKMVNINIIDNNKKPNIEDLLKTYLYFSLVHSRIANMKDWPYDIDVLMNLAGAILIPIIIGFMEFYLK